MNFFSTDVAICDIIIFVFGVIEGLWILYTIFAPISEGVFGKYMSWYRFNRLIKSLAKQIEASGIKYKMIVAPGRDGAICAGLLSCYLGSIPVLVLDREYETTATGQKYARFHESKIILDPHYDNIKESRILLLTQRSDPGITLEKIAKIMEDSGFKYMDQCAVLKSQKSMNTNIKYCGHNYLSGEKKFKKFPWERIKQYRDIM